MHQLGLGGQDVTALPTLLLKGSGAQFSSATLKHDIVTNIKEHMCYVSTDPSSETAKTIKNSADTVRMVTQGIPSLLVSSVLENDADLWQLILDNVVLTGGSSLLPGMGHRLREKASALALCLIPLCMSPETIMHTATGKLTTIPLHCLLLRETPDK
uniref:Actin related protein 10 n=1 Tax=Salmo trutta TaxID=8032 RepID=A0A674CFQ0_SALTR